MERRGRRSFLDADVKRPVASVTVIVDEGNRVVFGSTEWYIENVAKGQKVPMCRRRGVLSSIWRANAETGDVRDVWRTSKP